MAQEEIKNNIRENSNSGTGATPVTKIFKSSRLNNILMKHDRKDMGTFLIWGTVCFATGFTISSIIWFNKRKK